MRAAHHEDEESADQQHREEGADQQAEELSRVIGRFSAERDALGALSARGGRGEQVVIDVCQLRRDLHLVVLWRRPLQRDGERLVLLNDRVHATALHVTQEGGVFLAWGGCRREEDAPKEQHRAQQEHQHHGTITEGLRDHVDLLCSQTFVALVARAGIEPATKGL